MGLGFVWFWCWHPAIYSTFCHPDGHAQASEVLRPRHSFVLTPMRIIRVPSMLASMTRRRSGDDLMVALVKHGYAPSRTTSNIRTWDCGRRCTQLMTVICGVISWKRRRRSCRGMLHDDDDDIFCTLFWVWLTSPQQGFDWHETITRCITTVTLFVAAHNICSVPSPFCLAPSRPNPEMRESRRCVSVWRCVWRLLVTSLRDCRSSVSSCRRLPLRSSGRCLISNRRLDSCQN